MAEHDHPILRRRMSYWIMPTPGGYRIDAWRAPQLAIWSHAHVGLLPPVYGTVQEAGDMATRLAKHRGGIIGWTL